MDFLLNPEIPNKGHIWPHLFYYHRVTGKLDLQTPPHTVNVDGWQRLVFVFVFFVGGRDCTKMGWTCASFYLQSFQKVPCGFCRKKNRDILSGRVEHGSRKTVCWVKVGGTFPSCWLHHHPLGHQLSPWSHLPVESAKVDWTLPDLGEFWEGPLLIPAARHGRLQKAFPIFPGSL